MTAAMVPLLRKSDLPSAIVISSIGSLQIPRISGSAAYPISKVSSFTSELFIAMFRQQVGVARRGHQTFR